MAPIMHEQSLGYALARRGRIRSISAMALCAVLIAVACWLMYATRPIFWTRVVVTRGVATERDPVTLPVYCIEPPDILLIEALRLVPKPPYRIQTTDILGVEITTNEPKSETVVQCQVDVDGVINLGAEYAVAKIPVAGLAVNEATERIRETLAQSIDEPTVSVTLVQGAALQPVAGQHLVGPDGTVSLGMYGQVYVFGKTLDEATAAVTEQLEQFLDDPQVAVSVFAYNSKVFYLIDEGPGGDKVTRLPITGKDTVLDAIAQAPGLAQHFDRDIWIARPAARGQGKGQTLKVDLRQIAAGTSAANYQILPGDRVFIGQPPGTWRDWLPWR